MRALWAVGLSPRSADLAHPRRAHHPHASELAGAQTGRVHRPIMTRPVPADFEKVTMNTLTITTIGALALDAPEMKAFTTYIAFLSRGVPIGAQIEGAAVLQGAVPNRRADVEAGSGVFDAKCAVCHGSDGLGKRLGQRGDAQGYTFPPLWGPDSFNNGAGMNRLLTATRFVRQNIPLGASHTATLLNDDEAYDVMAFVLSRPRPVKAHLEADFPARWNKPIDAAFPPYMLGAAADQHRYGPFPPLAERQRAMSEQRNAVMAAKKARAAEAAASSPTR